jgi:glucose-1-phosphate cytidylyltransferase
MREYSETIPKPMVPIGHRPILWHLMRTYAHYGHKEFILCLGHKGEVIKEYFVNYKEWLTSDFVLSNGRVELENPSIEDWSITFAETGLSANVGERLMKIKPYLDGDDVFLANYGDVLADVPLPSLIDHCGEHGKIASCVCVRPAHLTFHVVRSKNGGTVESLQPVDQTDLWINGGFFIFRKEIFDFIGPGEDLVVEPFKRLIDLGELATFRHDGFWLGMDTFKELQRLNDMYGRGEAPWTVWERCDPQL